MASEDVVDPQREKIVNILVVLVGLFISIMFLALLQGTIDSRHTASQVETFLGGVVSSAMICFGIALILMPLRTRKVVEWMITLLVLPFGLVLVAGYYSGFVGLPLIAFSYVFAMSVGVLHLSQTLGLIPPIAREAVLYVALSLTALLFTYNGQRLLAITTRIYARRLNYNRLITMFQPNSVRLTIYGMMLISYVLANIEEFAGVALLPWEWWTTYKNVLVEVLLTVGLFDALVIIWKESREIEENTASTRVP